MSKNIILLILFFIVSCKEKENHIKISHYDVSKAPECKKRVISHKINFETMNGDDGSILFFNKKSGEICLKRKNP
jgi:hypothetical protein